MKGYLVQLWNDPAFFANTIKSLLVTAGTGAGIFMAIPAGRTLTEKLLTAGLAALAGGTASLPSVKKE